jgi:hypothetical protein
MSDKYDEVASLIYFDDDGQGRTSRERIAAILRRSYPAASAQSAEPQEAEAWDPLETLAAAVKVLWDDVRMIVTKDSACSRWHEDAILALAALRARLASKPSRSEAEALLDFGFSHGIEVGATHGVAKKKELAETWAEVRVQAATARPSREEELRELSEWREIKELFRAENVARPPMTIRRCFYHGHAHDIDGIWDSDNGALAGKKCAACTAARAALAQGGARDEGEGEVKQMLG